MLAGRSPYNSIEVELPEAPEGHDEDQYAWAATLWREWHAAGIVEVADEATLYVYRMTFTDEEGTTRSTTGVLGALVLDPAHTGDVLPHERTTPKDKTDRLSLLRAARTNFSPIWGLSLAGGLGQLCDHLAEGEGVASPYRVTDDSGALHECWRVRAPEATRNVVDLVASTPVLIADGHHRYETACTYLEETGGTPGSDAVLALVVELTGEELAVEAIHRTLRGLPAETVRRELGRSFDLAPGPADPLALRSAMSSAGALGLVTEEGSWLMAPRGSLLREGDDQLDSTRLDRALEHLPDVAVAYQHGALQVARAVREGQAEAAVLLRPVSVDQIAAVARGGRRMPPKSTFFYPKPLTGLVFRELDAG